MEQIRKKLGLGYLRRGAEQAAAQSEHPQEPLPPYLGDALIAYGRAILDALQQAEPATARLHALVEQLQMPIDVALKVTEYLEAKKYLVIAQRDLKGDHELRLTEDGRRLIS